MDETILDCLIVGGGPAGLTAAIYLARFHLDILVVDGGKSRAALDPVHAQPRRLSGRALPARSCSSGCASRRCEYGAKIETEFVTRLERDARERSVHARPGARAARGATGAARDRRHQPPPADGRGACTTTRWRAG